MMCAAVAWDLCRMCGGVLRPLGHLVRCGSCGWTDERTG